MRLLDALTGPLIEWRRGFDASRIVWEMPGPLPRPTCSHCLRLLDADAGYALEVFRPDGKIARLCRSCIDLASRWGGPE